MSWIRSILEKVESVWAVFSLWQIEFKWNPKACSSYGSNVLLSLLPEIGGLSLNYELQWMACAKLLVDA